MVVLGLDWLRNNEMNIDCARNVVYNERKYEENAVAEEGLEKRKIEKDTKLKSKILYLRAKEEHGQKEISQLAAKQRSDGRWGVILRNIEERGMMRQGVKRYCMHAELLFLRRKESRNGWVLCISKEEVMKVLKSYHDENFHSGITKMRRMLYNLFTWKGMAKDIIHYVRSCHACQVSKYGSYKFSGPLQAIIPNDVGELVAIDILGPMIRSRYGFTCVLVIIDIFSKFIKLYGLRRVTSTACLKQIGNYIREYGVPRRLLSDNGPQFTSKRWKKSMCELGIKELHTAVRNPRGNPCERYIKVVGECLRISCRHQHSSWATYLKQIENFINFNYNETTEVLPVELQF